MIWVLTVITVLACAYAIWCQYKQKTFEMAFEILVRKVYKPRTQEDMENLLEIIMNELDGTEESDS